MSHYNNDIDNSVDDVIYECLNPNNPKSFFLFAGAGSGKTRTLVNVLKLFKKEYGNEFRFKNRKVAIITYTNAAAQEINHRLEFDSIYNVSTIHSFCWDLIKSYTSDIKFWIKNNLENEISSLEEEQSRSKDLSNKTSVSRAKKIDSKVVRLNNLNNVSKFVYNPNGDNISKDSLNHTEVISITADLISSKELMGKILLAKYPIILIDESQDTKKDLIESLFQLQKNNPENFTLGLFGDTMQRIYTDGKENLGQNLPEDWLKPSKKINHRSKSRIIELINKIRNEVDGQEQLWRTEKDGGFVRIFVAPRGIDKFATEKLIKDKMYEITKDESWQSTSSDIKTLTLEHHMAALRMGFDNFFNPLYLVDRIKTGLLDGTYSSVSLFTKIILPLIIAHKNGNKFEVANIVKKHSELLDNQSIKIEEDKLALFHLVNEKVKALVSLWEGNMSPTLLEILDKVDETGLFKLTSDLKLSLEAIQMKNSSFEQEESVEILSAWEQALNANFEEIVKYQNYISESSSFGTHQGVKGLEYDRVLVIIDDEESRGFMFSYDKLFGIKELSKTDQSNIAEGKETGLDRTLRLFYVACSRAKESLAIVAYTESPKTLKENLIKYAWVRDEEIEIITLLD